MRYQLCSVYDFWCISSSNCALRLNLSMAAMLAGVYKIPTLIFFPIAICLPRTSSCFENVNSTEEKVL